MQSNRNHLAALVLMLGLGSTAAVSAAPVVVTLDQSNVLADGVAYLQVAVSEGIDGAIDFAVQVLDPLRQVACTNFGIRSFAFNVIPGGEAESASVTNLPAGWIVRDSHRVMTFGRFDIKLSDRGRGHLDTLSFSITGIDGDRPEDYAVLSTGKAVDGHQFFAARVAGLDTGKCETTQCAAVTSALFGGSAAVPAPGAGWLFLSAAALVATRLRRRRVCGAPETQSST